MNPVDHPHGGRAKSIKYPRTPWGLTTKYKQTSCDKLQLAMFTRESGTKTYKLTFMGPST